MSDHTRIDIETDPLTQRMKGVTAHGNVHFDVPLMSEIATDLFQGGCVNGMVLPRNIKHIVSLYKWERYTAYHDLETYLEVEMYDSGDQGFKMVRPLAEWVATLNGPVLIHCQAGLNRSSLIMGAVLMDYREMTPSQAIHTIRTNRSSACLVNRTFERYLLEEY